MADTTGVRQAATVRSSASSENGSRSSSEPPPLAITITSTSGSASSFRSASMTSPAAYGPCTADCSILKRTAGHRRCAFCTTSRSAADSRPQISPMTPGRNGSARFRSAEKRPSAAELLARRLIPGGQLADPDGADLERGERERAPGGVEVRLHEHHDAGTLGGAHRFEDL